MHLTKDAHFAWDEFIKPYFEGLHSDEITLPSLWDYFNAVEPFWRLAAQLDSEEQYRLAQLHALTLQFHVQNIFITMKRDEIMKRLREAEADRRGCEVKDLYLFYPHDEVDKIYPIHGQWWKELCGPDMKHFATACNKARIEFNGNNRVHVESFVHGLENVRQNLTRRYLKPTH